MFDKEDIYHPERPALEGEGFSHPNTKKHLVKTYLFRTLLVVGTLIQWFLLHKLWIGKPLPEILGEINGITPSYGVKPTLFKEERNFDPLNVSDPRWTDLLPKVGGGFVKIPSWQDYSLLPAPVVAPSDGTESYNIAVFHQLHCLTSIAELVEELLDSDRSAIASKIPSSRRKHIGHCFQYLRLALRCCGDTTLEGQGKTVEAPGIDGFGAWHMCRDIDSISEWAYDHRAAESRGLPI